MKLKKQVKIPVCDIFTCTKHQAVINAVYKTKNYLNNNIEAPDKKSDHKLRKSLAKQDEMCLNNASTKSSMQMKNESKLVVHLCDILLCSQHKTQASKYLKSSNFKKDVQRKRSVEESSSDIRIAHEEKKKKNSEKVVFATKTIGQMKNKLNLKIPLCDIFLCSQHQTVAAKYLHSSNFKNSIRRKSFDKESSSDTRISLKKKISLPSKRKNRIKKTNVNLNLENLFTETFERVGEEANSDVEDEGIFIDREEKKNDSDFEEDDEGSSDSESERSETDSFSFSEKSDEDDCDFELSEEENYVYEETEEDVYEEDEESISEESDSDFDSDSEEYVHLKKRKKNRQESFGLKRSKRLKRWHINLSEKALFENNMDEVLRMNENSAA